MDIIQTEKSIRRFLKTTASIETIIESLSKSGPTVDRYHSIKNDTVLEIEVITNRIDTVSAFGIAREANAILKQNNIDSKLENSPYLVTPINTNTKQNTLNFTVQDPDTLINFGAVAIDNITVSESNPEDKLLLEVVSQRPINNLVDSTNISTLLYGMPSHIFDKDKLSLQKLLIRPAKAGETITTLDNSKLTLNSGDLVIEDGSGRLVDLCGIMGGQVAEVDMYTKNIVAIIPVCKPNLIRKTSLFHQKRTLAAQIFEKSPDPELCLPVLKLLSEAIISKCGGNISSEVFEVKPKTLEEKRVNLSMSWLTKFSGVDIKSENIISILTNLGFICNSKTNGEFEVQVPSFRYTDINIKEDLAEEITRIYGYENISPTLPPFRKTPPPSNTIFNLEKKTKSILSSLGYNEVYNNSLISKDLITKTNLDVNSHLSLTNALTQDYEYLRTTLIPNAIQNHSNNIGKVTSHINFFEIANIYKIDPESPLPTEISTLCLSTDNNLLVLKNVVEKLLIFLNYKDYSFNQPSTNPPSTYQAENTADIVVNDKVVGQIGEIKTSITRKFGLTSTIYSAEIDLSLLNSLVPSLNYTPISDFPIVKIDVTITSTEQIGKLTQKIKNTDQFIQSVIFKGSYKNNHTFEIAINSTTQNLTQSDANTIREKIFSLFADSKQL